MVGKVYGGTLQGIEGLCVCVEADVGDGLPQFDMVGFLSGEVKEARERVRTAIKNTGLYLPPRRYTINLSPADVRKEGNGFDLPIAVAVLIGAGVLLPDSAEKVFFIGELGLDGVLRPIAGVLSMVTMARNQGFEKCLVPYENGLEASIVQDIQVYPMKSLGEVMDFLMKKKTFPPLHTDVSEVMSHALKQTAVDFSDIHGQVAAKRATEVAAAGGHNLLYIGPPGSGKSMLAKRFSTILPALTLEEAIEITKIYSICGLLPREKALICERPFRNPHHTTSMQALVGGGTVPRPGEVTLSHRGVLFLDELPEFHKSTLEVLRQPLEDHEIVLARVHGSFHFPADCQLVAAMNPCSCGYYPDRSRCHCSQPEVSRYLGRISQPLLDRIDICVEVPKLAYEDLQARNAEESSASIRERVEAAVERQRHRYRKETILFNSQLTPRMMGRYCPLGKAEEALLKQAFASMNLSARAYHRMIKVGRTIADLAGSDMIKEEHLCEAIGYRTYDKEVWK